MKKRLAKNQIPASQSNAGGQSNALFLCLRTRPSFTSFSSTVTAKDKDDANYFPTPSKLDCGDQNPHRPDHYIDAFEVVTVNANPHHPVQNAYPGQHHVASLAFRGPTAAPGDFGATSQSGMTMKAVASPRTPNARSRSVKPTTPGMKADGK
jgi:hypothetical protein